jgi:hypothetical protein
MPLTRKQQILAKLETSEGVDSSPAAADAMLVFDPTIADDVANTDRVPAGATLSRDFVPMGRKSRTMTFTSDFRGSADTSIPITVPDWGTLLQACAYKSVTPIRLPITSPTGTGFQLGEIVQKSSTIRGVVIGLINTFLVPNFVTHRLSNAGDVVVAPIQGTFTSSGTLTGESSGTTATLGTVANYPGLAYMPTSEKVVTLTVSSWSSSAPAVGDVLRVRNGSVVVGHAQIIAENSVGTMLDFDVTLLAGTIATGNTLATADTGGSTATIATGPTQKRTPSLSFRHNLDGRRRGLVGARGDFELRGDAGGPLSFSWTFNGEATASLDAVPVATSGLSSIRPPRLLGAIVAVGRAVNTTLGDSAVDFFRLPTKSVGLQAGNTVAPNLDANAANGSTGANVTDRDPQISATIDQIHSGFDWEDFRDNARACRIAVQCGGNTPGQIVGFVAPNVQVLEAAVADADGVAAWDLNMRPRRVLESGDDEIVIFQL